MRPSVIAFAGVVAAGACGADLKLPSAPGPNDVAVLVGAGDIAVCGAGGSMATGRLLDGQAGTVFVAGDIAYPDGTAEQFQNCYEPAWGRHKDRTRPAPGNHEYGSPGAAPYFAYFGANAGPAGRGYYMYRKGTWQVFSLNSNTESGDRRAQVDWLGRELDAPGTLGLHGRLLPSSALQLWLARRGSADAGGDRLVESALRCGRGRRHFGARTFLRAFRAADSGWRAGSSVRHPPVHRRDRRRAACRSRCGASRTAKLVLSTFGVLRLTLDTQSYRWEFLSSEGGAILDAGTGRCHGKP